MIQSECLPYNPPKAEASQVIVSALAIYNEMLLNHPNLLKPLWKGFHLHRFGEELPGDPPYSKVPIPVISEKMGVPSVVLMRGYIDMAVDEFDMPFSDQDREAMDLFEEIGNRPDFRLDFYSTARRGNVVQQFTDTSPTLGVSGL